MSSFTEHWVEINIDVSTEHQDEVLLGVLRPYVRKLQKRDELCSYHYFREPEIRFRIRLASAKAKAKCERELAAIAKALVKDGRASEWHFGNHGEDGRSYAGEVDRYGKNGWKVAQSYFNQGSEIALKLLELERRGQLENPLWGKGLGNPWEGGAGNPWKSQRNGPIAFHWSRYVHLFSNQLGFSIKAEVALCNRQANGYRRVLDEVGMEW